MKTTPKVVAWTAVIACSLVPFHFSFADQLQRLHFGSTEVTPKNSPSTLSPDASANSIIFEGFVATADGGGKVAGAVATVTTTIEGQPENRTLTFDVRGSANIEGKNSCFFYVLDGSEAHKRMYRLTNNELFLRWQRPVKVATTIQLSLWATCSTKPAGESVFAQLAIDSMEITLAQ